MADRKLFKTKKRINQKFKRTRKRNNLKTKKGGGMMTPGMALGIGGMMRQEWGGIDDTRNGSANGSNEWV